MAVISLSVLESTEEVISGIPRFITISSNINCVIFYTLDGSIPNTNSTIYTGPIQLPTDLLVVNLNIYATNGADSSPVLNYTYQTIEGLNIRVTHSATDAIPNSTQGLQNPYPFGDNPLVPGQKFIGAAAAGYTVDNPSLPETPTGFDSNGNPTGFVNQPLIGIPTESQPLIYSDSDFEGNRGPGIGTLPPSRVQSPVPPPEQMDFADKLFDPRALVIFQDFTKPNDPTMPVEINRQFYSQDDDSHVRDGALYFNSVDTQAPSGTFLRQHYNPTDQTLTYYYWNSRSNRWIISKTSYTPSATAGRYYNLVFGRGEGAGFVFQWQPFKGSVLF